MGFPDAEGDCGFGAGEHTLRWIFSFFYLEWTEIVWLGRLQNKGLVAANEIMSAFNKGYVSGVREAWKLGGEGVWRGQGGGSVSGGVGRW